jgi:hypothetical protein
MHRRHLTATALAGLLTSIAMLLSAGPGSAVAAPARGCKPFTTGFPAISEIRVTDGTCSLADALGRAVQHNKAHVLPKRIGPLDGDTFVCSYRARYLGGRRTGPAGDLLGFGTTCRSHRDLRCFLIAVS